MVLKDLPSDTAKFFIKAPDNNVVEFLLSKKVILVEGDAEYMLMEEFYKNVSGTTLDHDQVHVISVGGISFKRYLDIAMVLKIRTAVIRDNDGDYQHHCVDGYADYQGEHIKIYGDKNDQRRTFEIALYEDNKIICDELFSGKRKKLSVLDYMLCNKSDSAYTLADKKAGLVQAPGYIRETIEWIRG